MVTGDFSRPRPLIIRSTGDQSLVGPAREAAKGIEDEQKRAQALLDIVKEIDYFANQKNSLKREEEEGPHRTTDAGLVASWFTQSSPALRQLPLRH